MPPLIGGAIAPNQTNKINENKTTFITSVIDGNSNELTNNGTTTSRSITFQFEERVGTDLFGCAIDPTETEHLFRGFDFCTIVLSR